MGDWIGLVEIREIALGMGWASRRARNEAAILMFFNLKDQVNFRLIG